LTYILSLGSNIGDRFRYINQAINLLSENGTIQKISSFYETEPIGPKQAEFINICIIIECNIKPFEFLENIKSIEKRIGREETYHWGPRIIDIDIIYSSKYNLETETLTIPHKELKKRKFILMPLLEISPDLLIDERKVSYWLDETEDKSQVKLIHIS
jgi:2-amino-4-hydroxy-6-hydroxymethyldihydropteridine diphosphokinase